MARVSLVTAENANGQVVELFSEIKSRHGTVSNIFQAMGNSAAVLQGYLGLNAALQRTSLSPQLIEKIALSVGQINRCPYCLAAHSAAAEKIGLSTTEIDAARLGSDSDAKTQTILSFVRQSVENRGWISDEQIALLKSNGVNDQELVEIVLAIAMNMFTNYFNHITAPEVDFPLVKDL